MAIPEVEIFERVPELSKVKSAAEFEELVKKYPSIPDSFRFEEGKVQIKGVDGFIDLEKISSEFDGLKDGKVPDLTKVFKELGVPETAFTPEFKAKIAAAENAIKTKYEPIAQVNATQNANTIPDPAGPKDVKPSVSKQIIDSVLKNGREVGRWVIKTLAANALTALTVFEIVEAHRNECNGCWKFSLADPNNKCKIVEFTCDQAARSATNKDYAKPCAACSNRDASLCALAFNPCVRTTNPGSFYKGTSTGPGPGNNGENCVTPIAAGSTDTVGCIGTAGTDNTMCSKNCSCEYSDNCIGYGFQCVNLSWGQAAADLGRIPLDNLGALGNQGVDLASSIIKILKIVAIVCGVLFILFIIFMIIKQVSSKSSQPPAPPVAQLPPTYPTYPSYPSYPQPFITPNSV